jgi:hypothetical protein
MKKKRIAMEQKLDFDDIFDIWQPAWWENPLNVVFAVCGTMFLALVVFWLIKKYWLRKKPIDPRTEALQQLYAINPEHVSASKEFYVRIVEIVKKYLDARYALQSSSKTEAELVEYLAMKGHEIWLPAVKHIVQRSVAIKFAQAEAEKDSLLHDYMLVHDILHKEKVQEKR